MKKGLFTVVFTICITVVFISALAFVNEISKERVAQNLEIQRIKSILYAFDILPAGIDETEVGATATTESLPWDEAGILATMGKHIHRVRLVVTPSQKALLEGSLLVIQDSVDVYVRLDENQQIVSYGFPLKGKGLWGTISAFTVVSSDLTRMVGIDFIEQYETPGLGSRVTEKEFKYFFRNLDLNGFFETTGPVAPIVMVAKKSQTNVEHSMNSVQAITGATLTCNGVLQMLNIDLQFYLTLLKENEQPLRQRMSEGSMPLAHGVVP